MWREELRDLLVAVRVLVFDRDAYAHVRNASIRFRVCCALVRLTHSSDYLGKEDYRAKARRELRDAIEQRA